MAAQRNYYDAMQAIEDQYADLILRYIPPTLTVGRIRAEGFVPLTPPEEAEYRSQRALHTALAERMAKTLRVTQPDPAGRVRKIKAARRKAIAREGFAV